MSNVARISPVDVRSRLQAGTGTLLVCAYEDDAKFRKAQLEGAISLTALKSRLPSLAKDAEIVFYWGWLDDASAAGRAAEYREKGYANAKVLAGGIAAWKAAGYPVHSDR